MCSTVIAMTRTFKKKSLELRKVFTERSVLLYLVAVETNIRGKAIDLARSKLKVPFGIALIRALLQESTAWQMENTLLVRIHSSSPKDSVIDPKCR